MKIMYLDESSDDLFDISRSRVGGIKAYQRAAAAIRGYRIRDNLTQEDLAGLLETSQSNVSAIETAKDPVGKKLAKKLAHIFKTDASLFLTDLPD